MVLLVAIEYHSFQGRSCNIVGKRTVGVCAMVLHDLSKVHICALAVAKDMRHKGIGTEMLKQIAIMYPTDEITLSIALEEAQLINFYYRNEYATLKEINTELETMVLSLVQLKLLRDVPLPLFVPKI